TTVCREITKASLDTQGKPSDRSTHNTGTGTLPGKPENSCTHNNRLQELPGARVNFYKGKSQLVIPLTDRVPDKSVPDKPEDFEIKGLQFIGEDGQKRFFGSFKGLFHIASDYDRSKDVIIICEGYATARSIVQSTDFFVVAGMSSCNMKNVAEKMAEQFPNSEIIIAADNDEAGRKAAAEALKAISGKVSCAAVYPSPEFNDFNDMYAAREAKAVKDCFDLAKPFAVCGENAAASRLEEMIHA
ncbi:MAG: toprim domain-containing protein, partial [Alphaproteobacteria bacterium]|nr:toprim domain-containing protein [Alphaproteobacteria bacterium]